MTGAWWGDLLVSIAAGLILVWIALITVMVFARPRGGLLAESLRLLPDLLRLIRRLAADPALPRGVRTRLALLIAYLALPIDLIPDFIPVLGYADDAIVVTLALRSVVRHAGLEPIRRHWPGTDDGLTALCHLTGLKRTDR
ncbi:MAG: DUF1232 domain-containing protein [Streptosporangiales bacterium]|nr:DUF1232 domain-containing protein [Streptosporangiales bacterium]